MQTGIYAAEFGRSLGGVVSLQTMSGGNTFHGSAFEFARDDALDANDWFNNRAERPKPDFSHHQFGATLGGPLVRNRTFFFGDYQGWRVKQDLTLVSTVPSETMRRGNFSELTRLSTTRRLARPSQTTSFQARGSTRCLQGSSTSSIPCQTPPGDEQRMARRSTTT